MAGTYTTDGMPNLEAPTVIPHWMRRRHIAAWRVFDGKWSPFIFDVMPPGVPEGISRGSMEDRFTWPKTVDAMGMSPIMNVEDYAPKIEVGVDAEMFRARLTKIGYTMRTDEFQRNFIDGIFTRKYQTLTEACFKYMSRLIEYSATKYIYGDTNVIKSFSNQNDHMERQLKLTASDSDDATDYNITGTAWNNTGSAKPYQDVAAVDKACSDLVGESITRAYFGQSAVFYCQLNDDLKARTQYTKDITGGVLGMSILGIPIVKVSAQRYKIDASASSSMLFYPGTGSLAEDQWASRNQYHMMLDSDRSHEWALFTPGDIGFNFWARVNNESESLEEPYKVITKEKRPSVQYHVRFERKFCPAVKDWARAIILDQVCPK